MATLKPPAISAAAFPTTGPDATASGFPPSPTSRAPDPAAPGARAEPTSPTTRYHYAPNGNFAGPYDPQSYFQSGRPGSIGFNIADVGSIQAPKYNDVAADSLPKGVQGLVYWGETTGVTDEFRRLVAQAHGDPKVFGIYVADSPPTDAATLDNIKAEITYIHEHAPDKMTFIVAHADGDPYHPSYSITPKNTGMTTHKDLVGLADNVYPVNSVLPGGFDLKVIDLGVIAAEAVGWSPDQIIPIYQAVGNIETYTLPTAAQERQILAEWAKLTPHPKFDYAYSWGVQSGDTALVGSPELQGVFAAHNAGYL